MSLRRDSSPYKRTGLVDRHQHEAAGGHTLEMGAQSEQVTVSETAEWKWKLKARKWAM